MDSRRTKRGAPPPSPTPTNAAETVKLSRRGAAAATTTTTTGSGTRSGSPVKPAAPVTRRSPARKSPARKSPARKSPARKSPARKAVNRSPSPAAAQKRRGRATKPGTRVAEDSSSSTEKSTKSSTVKSSVAAATDDESPVKSMKVSLAPLSNESLREAAGRKLTSSSITTTKTSYTSSATRVKVSNVGDDMDDATVARLTADAVDAARAKLFTPTPSELSRRGHSVHSRSVHSYSRSQTHEYSDKEDGDGGGEEDDEEYISNRKYNQQSYQNNIGGENKRLSGVGGGDYFRLISDKSLREFYGPIGAGLLILLATILGFYVQFSCVRKYCPPEQPGEIGTLEKLTKSANIEIIYLYVSFAWILAFLSTYLPWGRKIDVRQDRVITECHFNGFTIGVLTLLALGMAEYFNYSPMKLIYRNYLQLCLISIVNAYFVAGWCYGHARYVSQNFHNLYGQSGSFLLDFFIGREVNPHVFNVFNVKMIHNQLSWIIMLVFNTIFAYKTLKFTALPVSLSSITESNSSLLTTTLDILKCSYANVKYDSVALIISALIIFYTLDLLWNEHHLSKSFELHSEGCGLMALLRYALFPFCLTLPAKYAFEHKLTNVPSWALTTMVILFLFGMLIKRRSNTIKFEYRMDPNNIVYTTLDTIPTFQGRRLIISSYWGLVRHPNYLGEIISYLSLLIPLIWHFAWAPLIAILAFVGILIHRAVRTDRRNIRRYDSAWTRYCQCVKYTLVPRIF